MAKTVQFITNGSLAANFTSDAIPCNRFYELQLHLKIDGSGTLANASFYVQGSGDGGTTWTNIPLDKVRGAVANTAKLFTHTDGDEAIVVNSNSANILITLVLVSPDPLIRVYGARTGGAADSIQGYYTGKVDA